MAGLRAPWARYLLVGGTLAVGTSLLPSGRLPDLLLGLVALSGAVALAIGVRRNRPHVPHAWFLLAAGMATWAAGGAVDIWGSAVSRQPGDVAPANWLYLSAYPLVAVGMLLIARNRSVRHRATATLDTAIITVGVGLLSWVFLVQPGWAALAEGTMARLVVVAYPLGNVLVFGAVVRLANAPGAGRAWSGVVAALIGTTLAIDGIVQATAGAPVVDLNAAQLEPQWLLTFVAAGAAGLHPSMRELSAPAADRPVVYTTGQVVGLATALLIGPALLATEVIAGVSVHALPVAIASATLALLVVLRMLRMVRHAHDQATTDDLTGLPNRRALYQQVGARLGSPQRRRQALLMLDLDGFKEVNDSLGHQAGDDLLVQVGDRLGRLLRADDLLVRLGGDEFAILLDGADRDGATTVAHALSDALSGPFRLGDMSVHSTVSIGIALFPEHGTDLSSLLRKADIAMYRSKGSGAARVFGGTDHGPTRLRLAQDFREALARDELVVHYQPKLDLVSGAVHGVEALVRWDHPRHGLLYPAAFLERVEEAGLMRAMTRSVLAIALDQAVAWAADGRTLTVAVNLSASSLVDTYLPDEVAAMLAARGLPPSALQLEITEEFFMADRDRAREILTRLRDHGIQIAVDDFGTGYSSLSYLRDLPIDELKLDRSFVFPMVDDARAAALVASTIALAHSLELRMVAEGVEDEVACTELTRMGCDQAQGFYLSRPLPAVELDQWLDSREEREERARIPAPHAPPAS